MGYDLKKMPGFIRKPVKWVYSYIPWHWKYSRFFWETYGFIRGSQWWTREKLEDHQFLQLSRLLSHAYENTPYYRRVFNERGFKPGDFRSFGDLRKLPVLTKEDIRDNLADLTARNIPAEKRIYVTTSGSTGMPLGFYLEKRTDPAWLAFIWRGWNWAGYRFGDRCAVLRGGFKGSGENGGSPWWKYDSSMNCLFLSVYDMTDRDLPGYVKKIEEFRPKVIRGLPSALVELARFINEKKLRVNPEGRIKAVFSSCETLYPAHRKLIEETYKCGVFDQYGSCENVSLFCECEKHEGLHDLMEYGFTEILDKEGRQVKAEGGTGEIVCTGFYNYAVPMIRYRIGDKVEYTSRKCGCGRHLPLIRRIEGRLQEQIVAKDGSLVPATPLNLLADLFGNVRQFRFCQEQKGRLVLKLVRKGPYTEKDTARISGGIREMLGNRVGLEIVFVDSIPRSERGKYSFLDQKLPLL